MSDTLPQSPASGQPSFGDALSELVQALVEGGASPKEAVQVAEQAAFTPPKDVREQGQIAADVAKTYNAPTGQVSPGDRLAAEAFVKKYGTGPAGRFMRSAVPVLGDKIAERYWGSPEALDFADTLGEAANPLAYKLNALAGTATPFGAGYAAYRMLTKSRGPTELSLEDALSQARGAQGPTQSRTPNSPRDSGPSGSPGTQTSPPNSPGMSPEPQPQGPGTNPDLPKVLRDMRGNEPPGPSTRRPSKEELEYNRFLDEGKLPHHSRFQNRNEAGEFEAGKPKMPPTLRGGKPKKTSSLEMDDAPSFDGFRNRLAG